MQAGTWQERRVAGGGNDDEGKQKGMTHQMPVSPENV